MKDPRDVIIAPVVSEKSYALIETNVYTFEVHKDAAKPEIRNAVEEIFGVKVTSVNTLNRKGKSSGVLTGGNLSILYSLMGSASDADTNSKILFLEEVDSEPWVMDHCLSHLRNAGKLADLAGIVIGECNNCDPRIFDPGYYSDTDIEDVFNYYFADLGVPVLYGLPLGHTEDTATIPMGARARLDADEKKLVVLESGVV